jgi:hypothetical protein
MHSSDKAKHCVKQEIKGYINSKNALSFSRTMDHGSWPCYSWPCSSALLFTTQSDPTHVNWQVCASCTLLASSYARSMLNRVRRKELRCNLRPRIRGTRSLERRADLLGCTKLREAHQHLGAPSRTYALAKCLPDGLLSSRLRKATAFEIR